MSLQIQNITKFYSAQPALQNVSFEVNKGEIAGFIGPNGAGKSTMMKIIMGYTPPDNGEVFVNGLSVVKNPHEIRKITGYLPENNPLYQEMYVREYLEYAAGHYMIKKSAMVRIEEILEETGLLPECHKKIEELSKGYRQRVGIAQALLHNPEILILDEPTSGLDPNQIVEIRNLILRVSKEKTIILSTHIMQEVEAICDRVIILNNGFIVANEETAKISGRTALKSDIIQVEFNIIPDSKALSEIPGILQVREVTKLNYLIEASKEKDIREEIFNFAVKNSLKVLSMQRKEKSLEEVFREWTNH